MNPPLPDPPPVTVVAESTAPDALPPEPAARSPLARRRRAVLCAALVAAVVSAGGLAASTLVKSPEQVAADAEEPPPSMLTAEVVRKKLTTTIAMRGTFSAGRQHPFTPTSVAPSASGSAGSVLIVTDVDTKVGERAKAGRVLLEVSERPVFALPGAFPAYRDMRVGDTGKDVDQLRDGLADLGYRSSDRWGHFGSGTASAVRRFYRDIGYPVAVADAAPGGGGREQGADGSSGSGDGDGGESGAGAEQPAGGGDTGGDAKETEEPEPMVPMSEVVFLPTLPARVAALSATVGATVRSPLITFNTGSISLTARLNPAEESLVDTGMKATVVAEATGFTGSGTVADVGRQVSPANSDGESGGQPYLPVRITRDKPWPGDLAGQDVRVAITTAATGKEVLAVPQAAIASTADGRTWVTVVVEGAPHRTVDVVVGVSADGMVEVRPRGGGLRPGDRVVTGK